MNHPCKETCSGYKQGVEEGRRELEEKLAIAVGVLKFYSDPETWIKRDGRGWRSVIPLVDTDVIRDYVHPKTDWTGTVVVQGKIAREALAKIEE